MMVNDWQEKNPDFRQIILNNKEKQIILGTLLGNSSIIKPKKSKNPHFQMRESINKVGKWILCKAHELKRMSRPRSFVEDDDSFRWNSVSSSCWQSFYELCYQDGKKNVSMEWLDQLQDHGIASWFMDKGELQRKMAFLRISRLNKESIDNIDDYFKIIGIPGQICNHGGSKIIAFKDVNLLKFMKLISHRLPLFYRLQLK